MAGSWATSWRGLLADSDASARRELKEGRAYHRSGRVVGADVAPGRLSGRVQGRRATPRAVEVTVAVLDDDQWAQVVDVLAAQLRHSARLLAGLQPEGLADELAEGGVALLPGPDDVEVVCACGRAQPCAHAAAVWEAGAVAIDEDPFALLRLRGRGRERLLAEIAAARARRSAQDGEGSGDAVPLDRLDPEGWTRARSPLEDVHLPPAAATAPGVTPLRLLGDPPGWPRGPGAEAMFGPLVQQAARWARERTGEEPPVT